MTRRIGAARERTTMSATNEEYGPVELVTIGFTTGAPPREVVDAVSALSHSDAVEVLDLVIVMRAEDGTVTVVEIDELEDGSPLTAVEYGAAGLVAEEDAQLIAETLPPGSSALVIAIEQRWERGLLHAVANSGSVLVAEQLIPSSIVAQAIEATGPADGKEG